MGKKSETVNNSLPTINGTSTTKIHGFQNPERGSGYPTIELEDKEKQGSAILRVPWNKEVTRLPSGFLILKLRKPNEIY